MAFFCSRKFPRKYSEDKVTGMQKRKDRVNQNQRKDRRKQRILMIIVV